MAETDMQSPEENKPELGRDALRRSEGMGSRRRGKRPDARSRSGRGVGGGGRQPDIRSRSGRGVGGGGRQPDIRSRSGRGMRQPSPGGGGYVPSPSELEDAEEMASLYNDSDDDSRGLARAKRIMRSRSRFLAKHKKGFIVFSTFGSLSIGSIIMLASVSQGPLEFIHLGQLLERFHFSSLEDAQNNRLVKIALYIHDPTKPQNARLGIAGNIAADHLESKLNEATGLKSEYNSVSGRSEGYSVIHDNEKFKGKNTPQIKEELARSYGIDPASIELSVSTTGEQTIKFTPDPGGWNSIKRYRAQVKFSRTLLTEAGYNKLSTHVGSRVLGARAGWTFHPIRALDNAAQNAVLEGGKKGLNKLRDKLNSEEATYEADGATTRPGGEPKAQETKDAAGNDVPNPQGQETAQSTQDIQNNADQVDNTDPQSKAKFSDYLNAKTVGAGAAGFGAGMLCLARNLNSSVPQEKDKKVKSPMRRKAGKFGFAIPSQAQSGQDIDAVQLGVYKDHVLDTKNPDTGRVTSTWNQARSIQAELGQNLTGPDLPKSLQVFNNESPFAFVDSIPGLGPVCGALESVFGQVFSIVTGPVSYLVSSAVLKETIPILVDWLSGSPISPVASGALFGNIVNYGARLSANDLAAAFGAVPLSPGASVILKNTDDTLDRQDFQSKSVAYRLFNTRDSRSLAGRLIDQQDLTVTPNMENVASDLAGIFKTAITIPGTLLAGTAHADPITPYNYHGLEKVGFSASELGDSRFDNPFKNACYVVGCSSAHISGILNDPAKSQTYIDRAQKCFGVNITDDGGMWNIDSKTQAVNFDDTSYPTNDCKSSSLDWLRIRFWLLDTPTLEGWLCGEDLDQQSCQDLGLGNTSNVNSTVNPAAGTAQQIAQQILNNPNVTYECGSSAQDDIKLAAQGKPGTAGAPISKAILQLIATIGQSHKVCVSALESYGQGHTTGSYHYTGDAVDFGNLDGVSITGRNAPALTIIKIAEDVLPNGSEFGQWHDPGTGALCGPAISFPAGFDQFDDTCDHLHVQVPRGTP